MADLKDVSEPKSVETKAGELETALGSSAVQNKFKSIIDRYPKIKEKVAQIKGASMGDSIVSDVKAEKQRKKIKLIKKMEALVESAQELLVKAKAPVKTFTPEQAAAYQPQEKVKPTGASDPQPAPAQGPLADDLKTRHDDLTAKLESGEIDQKTFIQETRKLVDQAKLAAGAHTPAAPAGQEVSRAGKPESGTTADVVPSVYGVPQTKPESKAAQDSFKDHMKAVGYNIMEGHRNTHFANAKRKGLSDDVALDQWNRVAPELLKRQKVAWEAGQAQKKQHKTAQSDIDVAEGRKAPKAKKDKMSHEDEIKHSLLNYFDPLSNDASYHRELKKRRVVDLRREFKDLDPMRPEAHAKEIIEHLMTAPENRISDGKGGFKPNLTLYHPAFGGIGAMGDNFDKTTRAHSPETDPEGHFTHNHSRIMHWARTNQLPAHQAAAPEFQKLGFSHDPKSDFAPEGYTPKPTPQAAPKPPSTVDKILADQDADRPASTPGTPSPAPTAPQVVTRRPGSEMSDREKADVQARLNRRGIGVKV